MTRADYDAIDAVRWSSLKAMARSPKHYQFACAQGVQPRTDAIVLGTVTHYAVFEPAKLSTHVAVWRGRRAGNAWEAFELEHKGKEIIKADAYEMAMQIAQAAREAAGKGLSEGESEKAIYWTHKNGLKAKGRLDHVSRGFGIWDLKSTRDASQDGFGRSAAGLGMLGQAAYYVDGWEIITGQRLPYTLLAVESKPPFAAAIYTVTEDQLELGRETYEPLLDRVKECQASGVWPSYPAGVLVLPKWVSGPGAESQDVSQWFKEESDG
jgi:hypothetical protein